MPDLRFQEDEDFIRVLSDEVNNIKEKYSLMELTMALNAFARLNPRDTKLLHDIYQVLHSKLRKLYVTQERKEVKEPDMLDIPSYINLWLAFSCYASQS